MSLWNNHKKQRDEVFPLSEEANTRGMFEVKTGKWRGEEVGNARSLSLVYRERFERLLASPKNLRDQLVIELPTLQGFRTGEVSSFRAEWVDFDKGILLVLDSNKHQLFPLPLHPTVAKHIMEYMQETGIKEGILRARTSYTPLTSSFTVPLARIYAASRTTNSMSARSSARIPLSMRPLMTWSSKETR